MAIGTTAALVGGAALSGASSMMAGDPSQSSSSSSTGTTRTVLPDYLQQPVEDLAGRITDVSMTPYQGYEGDRVAGFTGDQLGAFAGMRDVQGKYDPLLQQASDMSMLSSQGVTPEGIQQFVNPYQQGVTDIAKREALRGFDTDLNNLRSQEQMTGAFGGSRSAIAESEMRRNTNQRLDDLQVRGDSDAYNYALQAAMGNVGLQQAGAQNLAGLAGATQGIDMRNLQGLSTIGGQQQSLNQAGLDVQYGDFLEERADPYRNVEFATQNLLPLTSLMAGTDTTGTQTGTSTYDDGSTPFSTALGMGGSLLSGGTFSGAPSTGGVPIPGIKPFKEGGHVTGYESGGKVFPSGTPLKYVEDLSNYLETKRYAPSYGDTYGERALGGAGNAANSLLNLLPTAVVEGGRALKGGAGGLGDFLGGTPEGDLQKQQYEQIQAIMKQATAEGKIKKEDEEALTMALLNEYPVKGVGEGEPIDAPGGAVSGIISQLLKEENLPDVFEDMGAKPKPKVQSWGERNKDFLRSWSADVLMGTPGNEHLGAGMLRREEEKKAIASGQVQARQQEFENAISRINAESTMKNAAANERRQLLEETVMTPLRAKNMEAKTKQLQGRAQNDPYLKMALDSIDPMQAFGQTPEQWEQMVTAKRNALKSISESQQGNIAVGTVADGYTFQGGDPNDSANWTQ